MTDTDMGGIGGVRVGEATNPGPPATGPDTPEPPRTHTIFRLAQGDEPERPCKIRLSPQGGVWIWIVHSQPPLRVAGRKTPAEALQKWLDKFSNQISSASQAELRDLQAKWAAHAIPPPPLGTRAGHRCRSAPLFGERQATPPDMSQSQTPMPVLRRLNKKGPPRESSPSQTETGHLETPPDARHLGERPSAASAQPPLPDGPLALTWDQISALASRPILVDRQIPKPCRGLFEQVMDHCLRHMPPLNDPMPGIGDHLYILPKLLLFRGSHLNPTYNQKVKAISRNCQTALRGEWNTLWQAAMDTPTPPFRRLGDNDSVVGDGGDLRGLRRPPTFSPALPTSSLQGMRTLSPHMMEYPRGTHSVPSSLLQR